MNHTGTKFPKTLYVYDNLQAQADLDGLEEHKIVAVYKLDRICEVEKRISLVAEKRVDAGKDKDKSEITMKIRGKRYTLKKKDIEYKLSKVEPDTIYKYSVRLNGNEYPVKQAISTALGINVTGLTTQDANRALTRLGFDVMGL
jgi:hypothetical protein